MSFDPGKAAAKSITVIANVLLFLSLALPALLANDQFLELVKENPRVALVIGAIIPVLNIAIRVFFTTQPITRLVCWMLVPLLMFGSSVASADGLALCSLERNAAYGNGDGIFNCPSARQSHENRVWPHLLFFSPCSQWHSAALKREQSIVTFVSRLVCICGPDAVARPVPTIVFGSLDGMGGCRLWPHIGEEIHESIWSEPLRAHDNATATVVLIPSGPLVVASFQNAVIDRVLRCSAPTVPESSLGSSFSIQASATPTVSVSQDRASGDMLTAAHADAPPKHFQSPASSFLNDRQPTEYLPGEVFESFPVADRLSVRHAALLCRVACLEPAGV